MPDSKVADRPTAARKNEKKRNSNSMSESITTKRDMCNTVVTMNCTKIHQNVKTRTTPLMSNASNVMPPFEKRSTLKPTVGTISEAVLCNKCI